MRRTHGKIDNPPVNRACLEVKWIRHSLKYVLNTEFIVLVIKEFSKKALIFYH